MAFNLTVLSNLLGTPLEPDFTGVDLLIEEVSEHLYRIDRTMFHVAASANVRKVARLRLGRVGDVPFQRPGFRRDEQAIVARLVRAARASLLAAARTSATTLRIAWFRLRGNNHEFPSAKALQWTRLCALRRQEQQEGQMAQGTGRKAGGGLARPVQPSADLATITGSASAAAQPGGFENVGSHSQEQPAKPSKQTGNHR